MADRIALERRAVLAKLVGAAVMEKLTNRAGFDGVWDAIDDEIRDEILVEVGETAIDIVAEHGVGDAR